MGESPPKVMPPVALPLPTTFGGVACLARSPGWWLAAWQFLVALTFAVVVAWALDVTWGRAIQRAVASLPDDAAIRDGVLQWPDPAPRLLHQGSFLSLVADPAGRRETGLSADATLSLETRQFAVKSLFGWLEVPYPPNLQLPLARLPMTGLISAWRGPILLGLGTALFLGLLVLWYGIAAVYSVFLAGAAAVLKRPLRLITAWKLAAAALLPGAILMTAAIAFYATRQLGLVGLLLLFPGHLLVGWVFCLGSFRRVSQRTIAGGNPFSPAPRVSSTPRPAASGVEANPFRSH